VTFTFAKNANRTEHIKNVKNPNRTEH